MFGKWHYFLRNYFGFSRRESRGFLLILPTVMLLYLVPIVYDRILKHSRELDYTKYFDQADQIMTSEAMAGRMFRNEGLARENNLAQDSTRRVFTYVKPQEPGINLVPFPEVDSIILQVVPGIGEVLAGRIIKYRESLGGFHQEQQLQEVFGITEEVADRIVEYFPFTPSIYRWVQINELEADELARHPYIHFGHAKVIVAYRKQHGDYVTAEDLLKIRIFNEEWLARLRPYLSF